MKYILSLFLFISVAFSTNAQTIRRVNSTKHLTVNVIDIVKDLSLKGYTLTIANLHDTLRLKIDSLQELVFDLDTTGTHAITVTKEGYKTVNIQWEQTAEPADVHAGLYLSKPDLSKKEKTRAKRNSNRRVRFSATTYNSGGFEAPAKLMYTACVTITGYSSVFSSHCNE